MKRTLCMLLALIMLFALPGCEGSENTVNGDNPLALYKDGEPLVWVGMARQDVYQALSITPPENPQNLESFAGLDFTFRDEVILNVTTENPDYSDWRGVRPGMKKEEIAKRYTDVEAKITEFEEYGKKQWAADIILDQERKIVPQKGEVPMNFFHIALIPDKSDLSMIGKISISNTEEFMK